MSLLKRAAASLLEPRAVQEWGNSNPPPPGMAGTSVGGPLSEASALQLTAVYGSVSVIADSLSSLPLDLMSSPHRRNGRTLAASPLITEPYAEISAIDWWTQYAWSMALRGNFFAHIIARDLRGHPTQAKPIHPDNAQVRRLPNGEIEYRYHGVRVPLDDVVHVRYESLPERLLGLNPIECLRLVLDGARAVDQYGASYFGESAIPSGTIEVEENLEPDETRALARNWIEAHSGRRIPAVLTGGARFHAVSISPEDSQFLETRQFDAATISGQIFRVPPHMIGLVDRSTSWGRGIEQQEIGFVRNTLIGYLVRGEQMMTALHPRGQFAKFDLSVRLRGDKPTRYMAYSLGRLGGWLNADEIRAEEDMPPLPRGEGERYLVPINSELLDAAIRNAMTEYQQQQTPPPAANEPG